MNKMIVMATLVTSVLLVSEILAPAPAVAGERVLDGALGAASGGIVFGPVGLVAGGLTGFVAGPNIARGLGLGGRHRRAHYARR
jgi:hypothetical protein